MKHRHWFHDLPDAGTPPPVIRSWSRTAYQISDLKSQVEALEAKQYVFELRSVANCLGPLAEGWEIQDVSKAAGRGALRIEATPAGGLLVMWQGVIQGKVTEVPPYWDAHYADFSGELKRIPREKSQRDAVASIFEARAESFWQAWDDRFGG